MIDWSSALIWWLLVELMGLLALPLAYRLFRRLPDRGYGVSKALGLLLVGYLFWLLGVLGFLGNDSGGVVLAMALVGAGSLGVYFWRRDDGESGRSWLAWFRRHYRLVLAIELVFAVAFVAGVAYRAHVPRIETAGGEKFMEVAFLNAIGRSDSLPPLDPWLSGYAISYYYFGYVIVSMLIRLSQVAVPVGFNLGGALLFALTATAAFSLVYNLVSAGCRRVGGDASSKSRRLAAALLGVVFVLFLSNLEAPLEVLHQNGVGGVGFWRWLDIPELDGPPPQPQTWDWTPNRSRWWWRASRVVSDYDVCDWEHRDKRWLEKQWRNENPDEQPPPELRDACLSIDRRTNIDEFPAFSFLLGDMHPHVLGLPFVLLALTGSLALFWAGREAAERRWGVGGAGAEAVDSVETNGGPGNRSHEGVLTPQFKERSFSGGKWVPAWLYRSWGQLRDDLGLAGWELFLLTLILGALGFLNTWDLPFQWIVAVGAYALGRFRPLARANGWRSLGSRLLPFRPVLTLGLMLGVGGLLLYSPFYLGFQSQAEGWPPFLIHVHSSTRLVHFGVMFGPLLFVLLSFLSWRLAQAWREGRLALGFGLKLSGLILLGALAVLLAVALLLALFPEQQLGLFRDSSPRSLIAPGLGEEPALGVALRFLWMRLSAPWVTLLLAGMIGAAAALLRSPDPAEPERPLIRFSLLLIIVGAVLTLIPDYFYIKDIFGVRLNTIFKFYFQAWVLWAVAAACGTYALLGHPERPRALAGVLLALGLVTAILLGLFFPLLAVPTRTQEFFEAPTLDGTLYLASQKPADYAAINWLNQHVQGAPVILEAPHRGGYDYRGRVSALTGLPTLMGWAGHEQQWRGGSYELPQGRINVVETLYITQDVELFLTLLHEYDITYIYVGNSERDAYNLSTPNQFDQLTRLPNRLLDLVYDQDGVKIYRVVATR